MSSPAGHPGPGPGRRRGSALIEFLLTLPIVIFLTGVTIYMSMAMLAKQKALVGARHSMWRSAQHGHWSDLNLTEGRDPSLGTGPDDRPRGRGEELDRLRPEVEPPALASTSDPHARDYWFRLYGNLPGRHRVHASRTFETRGNLWNFLQRRAHARHLRDSSPWHFHHIDGWKMARSGPLRTIFDSFRNNLEGEVAEHFEPIRDDILHRMFHASGDELEDDDDLGRLE